MLKKRTILSILITIVIVILTNKQWLTVKQKPVNLDIKNKESFNIVQQDKTLKVKTSVKFDFKIFVIILILAFLFVYKLSDYAADFKSVEGKSRIEIAFLTLFFITLFIPMSYINQDEISEKENRALAKWKPFISKNEINYDFGKDFNNWFNDRFNLKSVFVNIHSLKYLLYKNYQTPYVIKGKEGWLFGAKTRFTDTHQNTVKLSEEELESIDLYLKKIDEYSKKNQKEFYLFIAPQKSKIYPEYYPDKYLLSQNKPVQQQVTDYIKTHSKVKIYYPKDVLVKHKKDGILYYKKDTHWNALGAYYAYLDFMKFMNIKPYIALEYEKVKDNNDLYKMLPSPLRKKDKDKYTVPVVSHKKAKCVEESPWGDNLCINPYKDKKVLIYRDSFATLMFPFLNETFGKVQYVLRSGFDFEEFNPLVMPDADIIILEVIERDIPYIAGKRKVVN